MESRHLIIICFLLSFSISQNSVAQLKELKPLPERPILSFDPFEESEVPKCSEILSRMSRLQKISEEGYLSFVDFMLGSSSIMMKWYEDLSPLEGQTVEIPQNLFFPIFEGADQITQLTYLGYDISNYISSEMIKISQAIASCLPQQGVLSGPGTNH